APLDRAPVLGALRGLGERVGQREQRLLRELRGVAVDLAVVEDDAQPAAAVRAVDDLVDAAALERDARRGGVLEEELGPRAALAERALQHGLEVERCDAVIRQRLDGSGTK